MIQKQMYFVYLCFEISRKFNYVTQINARNDYIFVQYKKKSLLQNLDRHLVGSFLKLKFIS